MIYKMINHRTKFHEKLTAGHLIKWNLPSMEPAISLLFSRLPTIGYRTEADESSPQRHILFLLRPTLKFLHLWLILPGGPS
jgi:hypothetical protein